MIASLNRVLASPIGGCGGTGTLCLWSRGWGAWAPAADWRCERSSAAFSKSPIFQFISILQQGRRPGGIWMDLYRPPNSSYTRQWPWMFTFSNQLCWVRTNILYTPPNLIAAHICNINNGIKLYKLYC